MTQITSFLFRILMFFTPLILWPKMSEVFEFPKMLFVYTMTTLIGLSWILSWIQEKKITIRRTPLDIPILIFLAIQTLSTVFSIDPHTSIWGYYSRFHGGLASTFCYIFLFYALVSLITSSKKQACIYVNTLLLSTLLISSYAILEHLGIDKNLWIQDVQSRVFSTLGQPNWLSAYLVAVLPISIFLFLEKRKAFHLLLSIFILLSIIFTKSQSGIAATGVVLLLIIFNFSLQYKKLPHFLSLLTLFLISLYFLKPPIITRSLASLNQINPYYSTTQDIVQKDLESRGNTGSDSMAIRRVVWQGAVSLGKKHPILGTGPETFAYSYYWERPAKHNLLSEWDFLYNKAHNEYLNFFANTGFLGLGSYLLLILSIVRLYLKNRPNTISTALFIGWLSILITNFFGFSVVAVALLFFLLPALNILFSNTKPRYFKLELPTKHPLILLPFVALTVFLLSSILNTFRADHLFNLSKNQSDLVLLESAVKLQPHQPLFLAQLAEQEAKTAATIFLQLDSLPETAEAVQKQYQQLAVNHATKATNLNPYNINLLKSKARVEIYLSNIDLIYQQQALNTLLQASLLAPTDAKLLFNIGILYQNLNKPELANESFKKALELKPNYRDVIERMEKTLM